MENEGRGIDHNTDFKRVYTRITETTDKTRLLIKSNEPKKYHTDKDTLIYSDEPLHKNGYINLHLHLNMPEDHQKPIVENQWVLENTIRAVKYINSTIGYEKWGHYKPVRYNSNTMSVERHNIESFFATTDQEFLKIEDFINKDPTEPFMFYIEYEIPKEFIKVYAESKGEIFYAMVQPFYFSHMPDRPDDERWTSIEYKRDVEGYIAMFPALSYNKAILESQIY